VKQSKITGPARVFDSEEACMEAILAQQIKPGDIVVIRYEGPKAGPACARCYRPLLRSSAKDWVIRSA